MYEREDNNVEKETLLKEELNDIDIREYIVYEDDNKGMGTRVQRNKEERDKGKVTNFIKILSVSIAVLLFGILFVRILIGAIPNQEEKRSVSMEEDISLVYDGEWIKGGVTSEDIQQLSKKIGALPLGTDKMHYQGILKKINQQHIDYKNMEEIMDKVYKDGLINYDVPKKVFLEEFPTNIKPSVLTPNKDKYDEAYEEMTKVYRVEDDVSRYIRGESTVSLDQIYQLRREVMAWGESDRKIKVLGYLTQLENGGVSQLQSTQSFDNQGDIVETQQGENQQNQNGLTAEEILGRDTFNPNQGVEYEEEGMFDETNRLNYNDMVESIKEDIKKQVEEDTGYQFE